MSFRWINIALILIYSRHITSFKITPRKISVPFLKSQISEDTASSDGKEEIYERLSDIHNKVFEVREYQMHIPPIANFKPSLNKYFTRQDVYRELTGDESEIPESEGEYMDGPIDVYRMIDEGKIPEYRHNNHSLSLEPGNSSLYTWKVERPADVFIINLTGVVYFGIREFIVVASMILLDHSKSLTKDAKELLRTISNEYVIPVWLSELSRYSYPYIEGVSDWVPALSIFLKGYKRMEDSKLVKELKDVRNDASALDELNKLTHDCDPFKLVDFLASERYARAVRTDLLYKWKEGNGLYEKEMCKLKIKNLNKKFQSYRNKLREDKYEEWKNLILYRTKCSHLDDSQKIHHEAFNNALVESILHHIKTFEMPVYLVSDIDTTDEVRKQGLALGIPNHELVHIIGSEYGGTAKSVLKLVKSLKIDKRIPIHFFDDRLNSLVDVNATRGLEDVRTYFVDWGRSTYNEKLGALYNNNIKYIKTTRWLVEFLVKFTTFKGREWTHGYRVRYSDEETKNFNIEWKKRWHEPEHKDLPGARRLPIK